MCTAAPNASAFSLGRPPVPGISAQAFPVINCSRKTVLTDPSRVAVHRKTFQTFHLKTLLALLFVPAATTFAQGVLKDGGRRGSFFHPPGPFHPCARQLRGNTQPLAVAPAAVVVPPGGGPSGRLQFLQLLRRRLQTFAQCSPPPPPPVPTLAPLLSDKRVLYRCTACGSADTVSAMHTRAHLWNDLYSDPAQI